MADKEISALTAAGALADADLSHITQSGNSRKMTLGDLKAFVLAAATGGIVAPMGRLTLTSNTPVMAADATAQSSVYYTPYLGKYYPWYSGSAWAMRAFTQLTMALDTTNQLAGSLYDLFVWNDSGTDKIGAGPAWINTATITVTIATPAVVSWTAHGLKEGDPVVFTTSGALPTGITAGTTYYVSRSPGANSFNISTTVANAAAGTLVATSGSQSGTHTATNGTTIRGTGAGTTELELKDGIWTNKNSITLKNGAGAGVTGVAANTATYVGTIYCTANGQTGMAFSPAAAAGGSNAILGVFNAYNRIRVNARSRDSTSSWSNTSSTWRAANGNVNNRVTYVDGLATLHVQSRATVLTDTPSSNFCSVGISRDSTATAPVLFGNCGALAAQFFMSVAEDFLPSLGLHYLTPMERRAAGGSTITFYGDQYQATTVSLDI